MNAPLLYPPVAGVPTDRVGSADPEGSATAVEADELRRMFPPGKQPTKPCLIPTLPEAPLRFAALAHLADAVAGRLGDRVPVLTRGMGTYPGYDTFPIFSVHGINPRSHKDLDLRGRPLPATYVCAVAVQDTPADVLDAAITAAQVRRMGGAA